MAEDPTLVPWWRHAARPLALLATTLLLFLAAVEVAGAASRGEPDPDFSADGQLTLAIGFPLAQIEAAATQPDGKLVLVGLTSVFPRDASDFLVVRLDRDGGLDPSFAGDGIQTTDFGGFGDGATAVAIAPDGKIVVGGFASNAAGSGHSDHAVVRYDADGNRDPSFSSDGRQTVDYGSGSEGALAVAVEPDGKVVLAGSANPSGTVVDFGVARLLADGEPDSAFSNDGRQTTDFSGTSDAVRAVAVRPDGEIVALGYTDTGGNIYDFGLARYRVDGELDPGFSGDGTESTDFSNGGFDEPTGLALQHDGRILAGGFSGDEVSGYHFLLARYAADGGLDPSFSGDGVASAEFEPSGEPSEFIPPRGIARSALALAPDGTAYLAGAAEYFDEAFETHSEFAVAAFAPDGSPDAGFSADGKATVQFAAGNSSAYATALDAEGGLFLAGSVAAPGGPEIGVARLFGLEPRPDPPQQPGGEGPPTAPPSPLTQAPRAAAGSASTPAPPATGAACRRARSGLAAASQRLRVARSRLVAAQQRLQSAASAGPRRAAAVRRSAHRARTRFENTKENRARADRKAATRC